MTDNSYTTSPDISPLDAHHYSGAYQWGDTDQLREQVIADYATPDWNNYKYKINTVVFEILYSLKFDGRTILKNQIIFKNKFFNLIISDTTKVESLQNSLAS